MLTPPIRIGILCSKRAPGLDALFCHPLHGRDFEIACIISNAEAAPAFDLPVTHHPIRSFLAGRGADLRDLDARAEYDNATVGILDHHGVDTVVLLGYLHIITSPLLDAFHESILNVHDSDLLIRTAEGTPKYTGLHATRDAILAGERETRSSVHLVTSAVDGGPLLVRSRPLRVADFVQAAVAVAAYDVVRAYAYAQREWMMRSWGDLVVAGLRSLERRHQAEVVA